MTDVTGVAIRVPRPRRGRRPRRPASFVLGSKNTDRHTSVATLVRDDRPSACALRACGPAFPRRGDSRIARRPARTSDKRAVEGAGPYGADGRFPVGEGLAPPAVPARVSDKRAVGDAGPYDADPRFPVGAIHESPADMRERPTSGPGHGLGAGPYGADGGFPANSEFRIPHSAFISRPYGVDGRFPANSEFRIPNSEFRIPHSSPAPAQRTFSTPNSNPSRPARHHNYSLFIIHYSSPSLRQLRQLRRLFPRRKLSRAVGDAGPYGVDARFPQIPNSEFISPPCDSCDGFSPVASCHKLSRAVAPGRICDETVNGFSENARKMIETKKTLWYNK